MIVPVPNTYDAVSIVTELLRIPGESGRERKVLDCIVRNLEMHDRTKFSIHVDSANEQTQDGGECGNLIVHLRGTIPGAHRILMAHMDTIPLCVGSEPFIDGDIIRSANPNTGLGADDRAGASIVLWTAIEILRRQLPHPSLTCCWTVQEERGMQGARFICRQHLRSPGAAFNFDGGRVNKITIGASGKIRLKIQVQGIASHAGVSPEAGASAILAGALAIEKLRRKRMLGRINRDGNEGSANIGIFKGGTAINVIPDNSEMEAEIRSDDPAFRQILLRDFQNIVQAAVVAIRNVQGQSAQAEFQSRLEYESYKLDPQMPCVKFANAAIRSTGLIPMCGKTAGGTDANWMVAHGIPTVSLGCGYRNFHSFNEILDLSEFTKACQIALYLATNPMLEAH